MSEKHLHIRIPFRRIISAVTIFISAAILFIGASYVFATTPNPGHPWTDLGNGFWQASNSQTALRTFTFPDADATVLTSVSAVTIAQGGTATTTQVTNGVNYFDGTRITSGTALTFDGTTFISPGHIATASSTVVGNFTATGNGILGGTLAINGTTGTTTIATGQGFTVGSNKLVVQQGSGNVGIGTTSPASKLQVAGNIAPDAANTYSLGVGGSTWLSAYINYINGASTGSNFNKTFLSLTSAGANYGTLQVENVNNNGGTWSLGYQGSPSSAIGTPVLTWNGNGNVGIGTTTPGSLLSVQGVGNFTTATSTLYSTGGISLTSGCFAIAGTCLSSAGALVSRQVLTAGTTYTPTAGTNTIVLQMVGGGGGGGGATGSGTPTGSFGAGGGSGGYAEKQFTNISGAASYTIAIGGAGSAGVAANGTGGTGGITTFACPATCTGGALTVTANGGLGGVTAAAGTTIISSLGGAGGAVSTNGEVNTTGAPGQYALRFSGTTGVSGAGAPSRFGGGGNGKNVSAVGASGGNYGAGGGGAMSVSVAANAGGAGSAGVMVVWEFK